jgi:enoyl-CoA hydratase
LTETLDELDELVSGVADLGPAPLAEHRAAIDRCFSGDSIEAIIEALEAEAMETEDGDWAAETLAVMAAKSPTSQKVAFRQMRRGAGLDFAAAMALEFRLSQRFCAGADFREGIRAAVIDKDRDPTWRPAGLAEVSEADVEAYFAPLAGGELNL